MSGLVPPRVGLPGQEELEELGDDVIISQSLTHAPQPRAQVREESASVVISERPAALAANRKRSARSDATVVIRDRRRLEEMRQAILLERQKHGSKSNLYWWAGAALAAFLLGGAVALVASGKASGSALRGVEPVQPLEPRLGKTAPVADPAEANPVSTASPGAEPATATPSQPVAVDLEDLPLERSRRR